MGFFKSLFGSKGWDILPEPFLNEIKTRVGVDGFSSLDSLAHKYKLFNQRFFERPSTFSEDPEFGIDSFTSLLTSMGNSLVQNQKIDDAKDTFELALKLKPDHSPARGSLSILYYMLSDKQKAKFHASKAIVDMDTDRKRMGDNPIPEEIGSDEDVDYFRDMLVKLAAGEDLD